MAHYPHVSRLSLSGFAMRSAAGLPSTDFVLAQDEFSGTIIP